MPNKAKNERDMSNGNTLRRIVRLPWKVWLSITCPWNAFKAFLQGATLGKGVRLEGKIYLRNDSGKGISIGDGTHVTGGYCRNRISRNVASSICTQGGGRIVIGKGVGISSSCIWARESITIGDHANIGADCIIMDHDAHSMDLESRRDYASDEKGIASAPVVIGEDALLGARVIVLKGVSIGKGSIVGAGSVVTKDVPPMQVWAGNPASFIKEIGK